MENASKALIIAGAILLSILLISLGIYIFTQAQTVVNGSGMTQAEVKSFNEQFLKYEGTKKGSEVKSLVQEVNVNNKQDESAERQIELTGGVVTEAKNSSTSGESTSAESKTYVTASVKNTQTYTITVDEYGSDGRITKISITVAKSK